MVIHGWDASDFDWARGQMDLAAAARDGISFFTHKATEGTRTLHARYGEALNRARAAGIPFLGAYVVPRTPGNNGHGSIPAQVDYFVSYLDAQTPWWRSMREFFLQVDTEHWGYDDVHPRYGAEACALLRTLTGKWVVHYAPRWAYGDSIPGDEPLWASAYGSNPAVPYRQAYPGDNSTGWAAYSGRTPTILQYGSKTRIGTQATCDANAFRGTLDQFRALVTGGIMTSPMSADQVRKAGNADPYLWAYANELDPIPNVIGGDFTAITPGVPNKPLQRAQRIEKAVTQDLPKLIKDSVAGVQAGGQPTQEQVNVAVLAAMLDPRVQEGIVAAIDEAVDRVRVDVRALLAAQAARQAKAARVEADALSPDAQ